MSDRGHCAAGSVVGDAAPAQVAAVDGRTAAAGVSVFRVPIELPAEVARKIKEQAKASDLSRPQYVRRVLEAVAAAPSHRPAMNFIPVACATVVDVIDVAQRLERGVAAWAHDHEIAQQWLVVEPGAAGVAVAVKPAQRFRHLLAAAGFGEASVAELNWSAIAARLDLLPRRGAGNPGGRP